MADENQTLVRSDTSTENVVEIGQRQPRGITCNRSTVTPILSIFVALLIAGQAVSVYFITQQQSKISTLSEVTTALKLKDMIKNLPGSPPSQNRQKLKMATFNIPLAFSDTDGSKQNLESIARESNKLEDAVKCMLLRYNPLRTYSSFNGTFLDNLKKLKKSLNDQEWMVFDAWMQQWYLFYLVQTPGKNKTAPEPTGTEESLTPLELDKLPASLGTSGHLAHVSSIYSTDSVPNSFDESPSGTPLMTQCMEQASQRVRPGVYVPQCDEKGDYMPKQCFHSTGYCWCVYHNGTEIPGTKSRAKIDCNDVQEMEEMDYANFMGPEGQK